MGRLDDLYGRRLYLDTSVFVCATEAPPGLVAGPERAIAISVAREVVDLINAGSIQAVTSELTLMEVQVKPLRAGQTDLVDFYRAKLSQDGPIEMRAVSRSILELAAKLRARDKLETPDALHLATAIVARCDVLVCNDKDLCAIAIGSAGMETLYLQDGLAE